MANYLSFIEWNLFCKSLKQETRNIAINLGLTLQLVKISKNCF